MAEAPHIERLMFDTYLSVVRNSVGSNMFRTWHARVNGETKDIMNDGRTSCAFFVSSVLVMFGLMQSIHGTIESTLSDMERNGWKKRLLDIKPGDILIWDAKEIGGHINRHIGFFLGGETAVSNDFAERTPQMHHFVYNGARLLEASYWRPNLFR